MRALLIADGIVLTAAAMLAPIYAVFVDKVGGDIFDAGITAAALAFGAGISAFAAGKYTDRLQNKRMIIVFGMVVMGVGFLLYLLARDVWTLAAIQLFIGLVEPLYSPAYDTLYSRNIVRQNEAEAWATWTALDYFATGAGALIGAWVVVQFGFESLFILMASLCFISAIYVLRLPKDMFAD